ncbi:DEAD/DEAH box helicase [Arthrospiribacter ruber]|uniref:DEAD-box ATP-dependent RNA helicase RhpA n=1 Tax=Arthrospiribacter ruber TaxID=2487934 RepID=A0A951IZY5_9BACT|nr:DEAD/DEAH box helicase [Arthrospiribacter ruber]MBW3469439.1 DEAD/DEAH box helicase [Arthrospiribacter ruber]
MAFTNLPLIEPILKAVAHEGYTTPTPIQQQSIPLVLDGHDLLGCAQTGTGKTAAFSIPIIQLLASKKQFRPGIKALILTPTRELAIQIDESLAAYGRFTKIRHTVIFGGVSQLHQTNALKRGVDILVATPGRLLDLINQKFVDLRNLEIFVLDEADRMLDMGFIHDVKKLIKIIPQKRQTLFFSATMPPEIQKLADSLLHQPKYVEVTPPSSTVDRISQKLYYTNKNEKAKLLTHLLEKENIGSALVFGRTKHGSDKIVKLLIREGIKAAAIHGNKSQNARQKALNDFKEGKIRVLVATDIAARGIDIDELANVFNYDLPNIPETYVHRIGRTGRAGNSGLAISFCDSETLKELKDIEKLIGKRITVVHEHPYPMTASPSNNTEEKPKKKKPFFKRRRD